MPRKALDVVYEVVRIPMCQMQMRKVMESSVSVRFSETGEPIWIQDVPKSFREGEATVPPDAETYRGKRPVRCDWPCPFCPKVMSGSNARMHVRGHVSAEPSSMHWAYSKQQRVTGVALGAARENLVEWHAAGSPSEWPMTAAEAAVRAEAEALGQR